MESAIVLISVEDNVDDTFLFQRAVAKASQAIQITTFENGQLANEYFARWLVPGFPQLPAVIVLDVKMPLVGGLEVLQWLRSHPVFAGVAVVMLTSSQNPSDLREARRLGAQAYLSKHLTTTGVEQLIAAANDFSSGGTIFQLQGDLLTNHV